MRALNQHEFASTCRDQPQTFASSTTASLATTLATSSNQTSLPPATNHFRSAPLSANTPTESTTTHSFPQSNTPDAVPVRATPSSAEYIFDNLPAPPLPSGHPSPPFSESPELNLMPQHPLPSPSTPSLPLSHTPSQHPPQTQSYSQALFHPSAYVPSVESSRPGPVLVAASNIAQSNPHALPPWQVPPLSANNPGVSPHQQPSSDTPFLPSPHQHALPPTMQMVSPQSHQQTRVQPLQINPPFRTAMADNLTPLPSPREGSGYAVNSTNIPGTSLRPAPISGSAMGMSMTGMQQGPSTASGSTSGAVHFAGRLPPPHVQYADDDGSEPRVDTRKGKERVMRQCSCGHYNHIRKNNCEKCDLPKPPPRKREKRPRRKKRFMSATGIAALSQSFAGSFGSYGQHHQQFLPHLQSPMQQQHVPSQHTQFGQSHTPPYLPQITPLGQHRAQYSEFGNDRQEGPASLIQEPEPSDLFRRSTQDYQTPLDTSAMPVLSGVHTTHSLSGPIGGPTFGRDEVGPTSTGFALHHSGDIHSSGHMLGPTVDNAGNDGNSRTGSPNMGGRTQAHGQEHAGHPMYHRMPNQTISMDEAHHRSGQEQLRPPPGLGHTILSTPPSDHGNASNREASLGGPLDIRGSGALGHGNSGVFAHGQTQNRFGFSTHILPSGAPVGSSDGNSALGGDIQSFQHSVSLPAVAEHQRLSVASPRHESRPGTDSSHGGRHSHSR